MLNNTREVLRLLLGELDPNDAYADLSIAADALDLICDRDAVVAAFNISCAFLNAQQDALH